MSVETALKVLGVSEGASFDEILRAKKSILASRKDDPNAISQVTLASAVIKFLGFLLRIEKISQFQLISVYLVVPKFG